MFEILHELLLKLEIMCSYLVLFKAGCDNVLAENRLIVYYQIAVFTVYKEAINLGVKLISSNFSNVDPAMVAERLEQWLCNLERQQSCSDPGSNSALCII